MMQCPDRFSGRLVGEARAAAWAFLLIAFVAAVGVQSVMAKPSEAFHAPQTSAEKALEQIVHTLSQDDPLLPALLGRGTPSRTQEQKARDGLSETLLQRWRAKERQEVNENCGGAYREGEICGIDYDPFFCAQDRPDEPLFMQSLKNMDNSAKIAVAWDKDSKVVATYDMVRTGSVWKVDNVRCAVERAE
jgi:hypothetical protein